MRSHPRNTQSAEHSPNSDEHRNSLITVVIPTYNEADNLPSMAQALFSLGLDQLQMLIVDDNSPDGTGDVADRLSASYGFTDPSETRLKVQVIHRTGRKGLGLAYVAGMKQAIANGADFVVQMDADFSHSPNTIPQMLDVMAVTSSDVVVGSRYVPGGTLDDSWAKWRRFVSWFANLYSRMILGLRVRDMTAGFKLWRRDALERIDLAAVRSNGYSFQVEMACICERLGFYIIELPIHFEDRRVGQSKMDIPIKAESAWRTWQIGWRYRNIDRTRQNYLAQNVSVSAQEPTVITWSLADTRISNAQLVGSPLSKLAHKQRVDA